MLYDLDAGMHSVTIELLRTGTPHNQTLSPGITYLALCGSYPPAEFRIDLEQYKFNQYLKLLRYSESSDHSRILAIESLQKIMTDIFEKIIALLVEASNAKGWLHVRLVMTPKELAMLPFELALTPYGFQGMQERPFLLNQQRLTTLTREIRQVATKRYDWPYKVRILFAWAAPEDSVPHEEHAEQLKLALRPWALPFKEIPELVPNVAPLYTEIKNASLTLIKEELEKAVYEKKPYTHVHILAHGKEYEDENGEHFALALQKHGLQEVDAVDGLRLASALVVVQEGLTCSPTVVTITACDSGNAGSPILRGGSLAHALHHSGIPCVYASQFPLSKEGSVKLVECLYPKLIRGDDPRIALYYAREALNNVNKVHDWASLVAYARFPEDIDEQLEGIRLKVMLESMKVTNAYADHVLLHKGEMEPEKRLQKLNEIKSLIDKSIRELEILIKRPSSKNINTDRRAENYGLLGSAYKRKAEYLYRLSFFEAAEEVESLKKESYAALKEAQKYYKNGFNLLPASHWTGCQYLSLTAVLKGSLIKDLEIWLIVKFMAERDLADPCERIWALGTLGELYLLKPLTVAQDQFQTVQTDSFATIHAYMEELKNSEDAFAVESTTRQLERYISWWPEIANSAGINQLKETANEIRKQLPPL